MSPTLYSRDWFIQFFEGATDSEAFDAIALCGGYGPERTCRLLHLFYEGSPLFAADQSEYGKRDMVLWRINDGTYPSYQQPTPKARILAALRDLPA